MTVFIFILSIYYYWGNAGKLTYFYQKTFVTPQKHLEYQNSPIIRVEIKSPQFQARKSFVKDVAHDKEGHYALFMKIPEQVDLRTLGQVITINNVGAQGELIEPHILQVEFQDIAVYVINADYNEKVALLVTNLGL